MGNLMEKMKKLLILAIFAPTKTVLNKKSIFRRFTGSIVFLYQN